MVHAGYVDAKLGAATHFQHIQLPRDGRVTFAAITPVNIPSWLPGGFYFFLMASVFRVATGAAPPIFGGLVVAALTRSQQRSLGIVNFDDVYVDLGIFRPVYRLALDPIGADVGATRGYKHSFANANNDGS